MTGCGSLVVLALLSQPGAGAPAAADDGAVRVQLEGTLGSWSRAHTKGAEVAASVLAGGGEFALDLSACADARNRLAAYADKARWAAFIVPPRVRVAGRLEFRPERVVTLEQWGKGEAGLPGPPRPVLVVDSFSLIESARE